MEKRENQHRTLYWNSTLKQGTPLDYVFSDQLTNSRVGDVIWTWAIFSGELFLTGTLLVGDIVDRSEAVKRVGSSLKGEKKHYAFAVPGTEQSMKKIPLSNEIKNLRFVSKTSEILTVDANGHVNGQRLQTMRILSPATSLLFEDLWNNN